MLTSTLMNFDYGKLYIDSSCFERKNRRTLSLLHNPQARHRWSQGVQRAPEHGTSAPGSHPGLFHVAVG